MKILLIYPPDTFTSSEVILPEGIARLTAYLRKYGLDVSQESLDAKFFSIQKFQSLKIFKDSKSVAAYLKGNPDKEIELSVSKLLSLSKFNDFDIIGFSIISDFQLILSVLLARAMKKRKDVKIIFGGSIFYGQDSKEILKQNKTIVDYSIAGESEESMLELLKYLSGNKTVNLAGIKGLVYHKKRSVFKNGAMYTDINTLPSPVYDDLIKDYKNFGYIRINNKKTLKNYFTSVPFALSGLLHLGKIQAGILNKHLDRIHKPARLSFSYQISRGCKGKCLFCNYKGGYDITLKSPKLIASDIEQLVKRYGIQDFFFSCNSVNINRSHLQDLCLELIKVKVPIMWRSYARPEGLDLKLLKLMKKSGCSYLFFGIESGSQRVLDYLNKGFTVKEAEKTIRKAKKAGIWVHASIMVNTPTEKNRDILNTIRFIKKNKNCIDSISIHRFFIPRGSYFHIHKSQTVKDAYNKTMNKEYLQKLLMTIKNMGKHLVLTTDYHRQFVSQILDGQE